MYNDKSGNNTSVVDALGNTTVYEYDSNGNMTKVTDERGNSVKYEYDALDNCIKTIFEDGKLYYQSTMKMV
ncbi:RHS repeat domain-containing protein [Herbivorax sp. ANBcel31]|uniref:RHS repeat domain-containing protein n=1 Tax=Herbivorax sp. ANBcel31 TaxID=3069754 RepID=UPI0027B0EB76|nr:RHS repeat domain-containing protein [Herbivorax sp. ANBcel31]MDQ2088186.1 RHS repeat domain-containing protein [Herbivorax sp. ANBcel31]